jgi:hypothetical protein
MNTNESRDIKVGGRTGEIIFLITDANDNFVPVPPEQATMGKVIMDDGEIAFLTFDNSEQAVKFATENAA